MRRGVWRSVGKWLLNRIYRKYEQILEAEILENPLPEHVAIIMDGNRRFARFSDLSFYESYALGARKTWQVAEWCFALGIKQLTIYAFSIENFSRPPEEREILFRLMKEEFERVAHEESIHRNNVRVKVIGNIKMLPEDVVNAIETAECATAGYDRFRLFIAVAYSGRMEILDAARKIAEKVKRGEILPDDIDEDMISAHLYMCEDICHDKNFCCNNSSSGDVPEKPEKPEKEEVGCDSAAVEYDADECDECDTECDIAERDAYAMKTKAGRSCSSGISAAERRQNGMKTSVDLIIRTGGEKRLSNFVPWQSLGNECAAYFCTPFWPGFRRIDLLRAIRTYQQREEERNRKKRILKAGCVL
ncbi:MAG: polyprenyl diphosphate synthase [Canidatus Methanoxibalbensis ujae]|nr:polyprenyl diphosphate synthase [Candidatus Methanoxibalbensis ujae]MCW7078684.1 polyprenyl diphosphate synthase [Candidatus Methanoxibalbensis ujae]